MSILDKLFHSDENEKNKDGSKKKLTEDQPTEDQPKEGDTEPNAEEHPHKHSKWHDALQQWANDNERDIEEDDADPLKSGL